MSDNKPIDYDELFPGRFIKSGEFKGRKVTLEITEVDTDELPCKGGKKVKGVVAFKQTPKQWVLNRTNGECMKAMFGRRPQEWIGKRVILYPAPYEGDTAIRVWGSPDIERETDVTIELPQKRPFKMTMHTSAGGTGGGRKKDPEPAPEEAENFDR